MQIALEQRFWKHVCCYPGECWEWLGSIGSHGYGQIQVFRNGKWQPETAPRVSYEIHNGPISPDMVIRHSCHNRGCVNPAHLKIGTQQENVNDTVAAGRHNCWRKLNWNKVKEIRERYKNGSVTQLQLANEFDVDQSTISHAINDHTWKEKPCT